MLIMIQLHMHTCLHAWIQQCYLTLISVMVIMIVLVGRMSKIALTSVISTHTFNIPQMLTASPHATVATVPVTTVISNVSQEVAFQMVNCVTALIIVEINLMNQSQSVGDIDIVEELEMVNVSVT